MVVNKTVPSLPNLGMPLIFMIASVTGLFTGYKINVAKVCKDAVNSVLPVLGILMGVGMFIQIMTLTGVRGFIVTTCLSLPDGFFICGDGDYDTAFRSRVLLRIGLCPLSSVPSWHF